MNNKIKQLLIAHINFAKGFRGGEMQTLLLIEYFSSRGYNQIVGIRDTNKLFLNRLQKIFLTVKICDNRPSQHLRKEL
jgi:hypothetical protein